MITQEVRHHRTVVQVGWTELVIDRFSRVFEYQPNVGMCLAILLLESLNFLEIPRTFAVLPEPDFNQTVEQINVCPLEV